MKPRDKQRTYHNPPRQVLRQQRQCPTCKQWCRVSVTSDGTGWEIWVCEYGHRNDFRIVGPLN